MRPSYWQRQTLQKPLFPELLWSRPEQKSQAGKLLIIGGNLHSFGAPAEAFNQARRAGSIRVVLPDATKKLVGPVLEAVEYAPSTPSGSFSQKALGELLAYTAWADAVLVAGDLGRNAETAILMEKFMQKYTGQLTLTKDAADYALGLPHITLNRPDTLLVLSFAQLQKLAIKAGFEEPFTFDMSLLRFVETLHQFTSRFSAYVMVKHLDGLHCAGGGSIISTTTQNATDIWRLKTATRAAVWWLQNPSKALGALATSVIDQQDVS